MVSIDGRFLQKNLAKKKRLIKVSSVFSALLVKTGFVDFFHLKRKEGSTIAGQEDPTVPHLPDERCGRRGPGAATRGARSSLSCLEPRALLSL